MTRRFAVLLVLCWLVGAQWCAAQGASTGDDAPFESMWGRSVTIAITGIDSRLGVEQAHADANHVLRIWLDQGRIEIISVPRGTYADAGFSSSSLNIIANYRARKGRAAYLRKLAEKPTST